MSGKRRDSRNRILRSGESQRRDGRYAYKYIDTTGKPQFVYSWKLEKTDKTPPGKRDDLSLREKEKLILKDIDDENQMQLVWIASSVMLEDAYNQYSSDANEDFVLNALEMMCEKDDSISVRSKSLTNEYLTISTSDSSLIKVVTIGIIPAAFLIAGIVVVVRRKRR